MSGSSSSCAGAGEQVELLVPMVLRVQLDHELLVAEPNLLMVVEPGQVGGQVPLAPPHPRSIGSPSPPSLGSFKIVELQGATSSTSILS